MKALSHLNSESVKISLIQRSGLTCERNNSSDNSRNSCLFDRSSESWFSDEDKLRNLDFDLILPWFACDFAQLSSIRIQYSCARHCHCWGRNLANQTKTFLWLLCVNLSHFDVDDTSDVIHNVNSRWFHPWLIPYLFIANSHINSLLKSYHTRSSYSTYCKFSVRLFTFSINIQKRDECTKIAQRMRGDKSGMKFESDEIDNQTVWFGLIFSRFVEEFDCVEMSVVGYIGCPIKCEFLDIYRIKTIRVCTMILD
jgi:hypothetical protein